MSQIAPLPSTQPSKTLEPIPNPNPERDYTVRVAIPEFTCLCPRTGQPDFAHLDLEYVPEAHLVELKSLKLYIWSFRNEWVFHEAVTNQVLDDLCAAIAPRFCRVTARFNVRGGTYPTIVVEHRAPGWTPAPRVDLP
jgi:7-cyano-7-deazaguanine reductase